MKNPENIRLLGDEQALLQAEGALAVSEQRLWQRLEALQTDVLGGRAEVLAAKAATLAQGAAVREQASRLVSAVRASGTVLAEVERTSALGVRREALSAREHAAKTFALALDAQESQLALWRRDLEQAEKALAVAEMAEAEHRRAEAEAVTRQRAERARQEAERQAAEQRRMELARAEAPTVPEVAPVRVAPAQTEPPAATKPIRRARRRKLKLAPPPAQLSVEVATWGDNNFYAGFGDDPVAGGLFVESVETLPEGHELELEIALEGDQTFRSRGRVEFIRTDSLANPDCSPGAGIKLLGLSNDQMALIRRFSEKRPPLFYMSR